MTLKTRFLAAAAALTLPAIAAARQPMTPPASGPAATQPSAMPRATTATTPPTRQSQDATETQAQQPVATADDQPAQQTAQTPPPASIPPGAATQPAATTDAQAQATAPGTPATAGAVRAATAADLRAGVQVRDQQGGLVGTVESADAASAVVNTGSASGRLALASFGMNGQGLVIAMTRAQLEAAVAAARPSQRLTIPDRA